MNLTHEQLAQINLTVDSYNYVIEKEHIICSCLIAGNDTEDRIVTKEEVANNCGVENGKILVTSRYDSSESELADFDEWFNESITMVEFETDLEIILNRRENRKPLHQVVTTDPFADIADMIDGMI